MSHLVTLSGVSVKYTITEERARTLQEYLLDLARGKSYKRVEFWALRDISFTLGEGESLGIVGANGAGKSTLLKVIAGILKPTKGEVSVRGRIAPLIELGAGFDPDLTGRENVYLNASLLGLSRRDVARKFDRIVSFSELGDFVYSPLRGYSSGMVSRLAFSIAAEVEADILIVDEVLSVGDEGFRKKCEQRIEDICSRGVTLMFVSHAMSDVQRVCQRALWLERGKVKAFGDADTVSRRYLLHFDSTAFDDIPAGHPDRPYVEAMFIRGITSGYAINGRRYYNPENKVSRAEFAVFLSKALGMKKSEKKSSVFSDVQEMHWASRHITWVFEKGFVDGIRDDRGGLHFRPDDYLTTEELYEALRRVNSEKCQTVIPRGIELVDRGTIARIFYEFFDLEVDASGT